MLTIHFAGGAVVRRETSQYDARTFLNVQQGDQNGDRLTWTAQHWHSWENLQVVYASFDAKVDQNWELASDHRRRLTDAGHKGGVTRSLVRLWERMERQDEPMYSIRVIVALHGLALDGEDRKTWEAAARLFEGARGAQRFGRAVKDQRGQSSGTPSTPRDVPTDHVRDDVEPEDGPTDSADPTAGDPGFPVENSKPSEQVDSGDQDFDESSDLGPGASACSVV